MRSYRLVRAPPDVEVDPDGNLIGCSGERLSLGRIASGHRSAGGRFDGAFGVVAAVEAVSGDADRSSLSRREVGCVGSRQSCRGGCHRRRSSAPRRAGASACSATRHWSRHEHRRLRGKLGRRTGGYAGRRRWTAGTMRSSSPRGDPASRCRTRDPTPSQRWASWRLLGSERHPDRARRSLDVPAPDAARLDALSG
jgi:hypothetical protein